MAWAFHVYFFPLSERYENPIRRLMEEGIECRFVQMQEVAAWSDESVSVVATQRHENIAPRLRRPSTGRGSLSAAHIEAESRWQ